MSTPFDDTGLRNTAATFGGGATASAEALAVAAAAFAGTFERWASHRALEAGASIPRLRLLNAVHCHGPQKMADLADALAVTPRNVTALVDGLEAERMVRRVPHSTDRRVTMVELTCDADLVAAQFATYQASIARLFADMAETDRATLLRLLDTLRTRMHTESGCATAERGTSDA